MRTNLSSPLECLGQAPPNLPYYACAPNDVWSLGVILVNLTCGRNPWKKASVEDSTFRAYKHDHGFLRSILNLSPELDAILACIFEIDPVKRVKLPTLKQMIMECQQFTRPIVPPMGRTPTVEVTCAQNIVPHIASLGHLSKPVESRYSAAQDVPLQQSGEHGPPSQAILATPEQLASPPCTSPNTSSAQVNPSHFQEAGTTSPLPVPASPGCISSLEQNGKPQPVMAYKKTTSSVAHKTLVEGNQESCYSTEAIVDFDHPVPVSVYTPSSALPPRSLVLRTKDLVSPTPIIQPAYRTKGQAKAPRAGRSTSPIQKSTPPLKSSGKHVGQYISHLFPQWQSQRLL